MSATFEELGRASITGSRSYSLKSRNVDQTFQIDVARPSSRLAEGQKLPVVYVLDGNGCFGLATQTARMLQDGGSRRRSSSASATALIPRVPCVRNISRHAPATTPRPRMKRGWR